MPRPRTSSPRRTTVACCVFGGRQVAARRIYIIIRGARSFARLCVGKTLPDIDKPFPLDRCSIAVSFASRGGPRDDGFIFIRSTRHAYLFCTVVAY